MISVVYRFFRPGSYFHARDNRLTVTSSSRSNFFKTFILDRQWCKGSYKWKITESYLLFIVCFVLDPIFTRETIGWLWRHRHVKLFQNHLFWTGSDARVLISGKLPSEYLLFIVFFDQDPIFTRETIGWLWRHRHVKRFQNIYFGQAVMQGFL